MKYLGPVDNVLELFLPHHERLARWYDRREMYGMADLMRRCGRILAT